MKIGNLLTNNTNHQIIFTNQNLLYICEFLNIKKFIQVLLKAEQSDRNLCTTRIIAETTLEIFLPQIEIKLTLLFDYPYVRCKIEMKFF